ncbi:MAG: cytochrome b N-terminal domain-containing protein [bacterium]|nr:cytochrome b N-terminal domain-containing protein [bacterium]MDT8395659.1 cytochrome b N-terminal domain-containing protein [bacterium]
MSGRDERQGQSLLRDLLDWIGIRGLIYGPLDRRLSLRQTIEKALGRPIPYIPWWGCFGGLAFALFIVQVLSGLLLMFFYVPADPDAHRSILYLSGPAPYGWLFRTVHYWAGTLMLAAIIVHSLRVFVTGAYQKPRDLNWVIGSALLLFTAGFFLTGSILPWTRSAYWSAVYWTDLVGTLPLAGNQIKLFLRGGEQVNGASLTRFYVFHVFILPAVTTVFMTAHFAIVRKLGISEPL